MDTIKEITKIKEHVDRSKTERTRLEGQREQLSKRLLEEFGCKTVKEAEAKSEEWRQQTLKLQAEVTELIDSLRSDLGWL